MSFNGRGLLAGAAGVLVALGLTACDRDPVRPDAQPSAAARLNVSSDPDDWGAGGGGRGRGGGEGRGGTPSPELERITVSLRPAGENLWNPLELFRDGVKYKAYTQFERNVGGTWQAANARDVSVVCFVNGARRDGEEERNASKVDLTFRVRAEPIDHVITIDCQHGANGGAYQRTTQALILDLYPYRP